MADMTMGQRIAGRRRILGISQEALGEKLGVSRQAISKWESDGAVPEIDKLIAMSKLFGVSVGWLLGTEEAPSEDSEKPAQKEVPRGNRSKLLWPAVCLALSIAVVCLWYGHGRLRGRLESSEMILSRLQMENNRIEQQLDSLSAQFQSLEASREENNEMFSQVYCAVKPADDGKQGLVYVTLVPKKWSPGDEVEITAVLDGKKAAQVSCIWDGTAFSEVLLLPVENGYEYYCTVIHADGSREQQGIENDQAENLARQFQVGCSAGAGGYSLAIMEGVLTLVDAPISLAMPKCLDAPEYDAVSWESVEYVLYKNGVPVDRVTPSGLLSRGDTSKTFHATVEQLELQFGGMEEGVELELWLEAALSNGMTGRGFVDGWSMENGEIIKIAMVNMD